MELELPECTDMNKTAFHCLWNQLVFCKRIVTKLNLIWQVTKSCFKCSHFGLYIVNSRIYWYTVIHTGGEISLFAAHWACDGIHTVWNSIHDRRGPQEPSLRPVWEKVSQSNVQTEESACIANKRQKDDHVTHWIKGCSVILVDVLVGNNYSQSVDQIYKASLPKSHLHVMHVNSGKSMLNQSIC